MVPSAGELGLGRKGEIVFPPRSAAGG